jgi:hypothetical protein
MALPTAGTQYNDFVGTAAIDTHGGTDLHELANAKGIDTKRYFPIGLGIGGIELESFTVYAVDTNVTKGTFDNIAEYAKNAGGDVPIVEFHFSAKWEEMGKYLKRFEVIVIRTIPGMTSFQKLDEVRLD